MYLLVSLFLGFVMMVWFDTNAFAEYCEALDLGYLHPVIEKYLNIKKQGSPLSFVDYLLQWEDTFFSRLITCPKCVSTWLGGIAAFLLLIPAMVAYGPIQGACLVSSIPFLSYVSYHLLKKI